MKKLSFLMAVLAVLLFNAIANATWTASFQIGTIKNVNDGRIIFTNIATGELYQFDATTPIGKNMLASVLACKSMGRSIKVNTSSTVMTNWYAIDQTEIQN
jgi:hypothetical protein